MIAEMKKLNLAAMSYDREKVLNALQRTGAAEVKCHTPVESVSPRSEERRVGKECRL